MPASSPTAAGGRSTSPPPPSASPGAGVPVSGTLAVGGCAVAAMEALARRTPAEQAFLDRWRHTLDVNLDQFGRMLSAGVRFVAGTDAGWRFTNIEALPMELALMRQGGMPAMAAIAAATGDCARALGLHEEVGTLRPGHGGGRDRGRRQPARRFAAAGRRSPGGAGRRGA